MLSTVMKDKEKIEETIEELDRYKRDALQKTWEKVNGSVTLCPIVHEMHKMNMNVPSDFGGIFAELLPGNFAKLQPPDGQDLMDGLEVKVQLGTVWKQSLTELSGGQRLVISHKPTPRREPDLFILSSQSNVITGPSSRSPSSWHSSSSSRHRCISLTRLMRHWISRTRSTSGSCSARGLKGRSSLLCR